MPYVGKHSARYGSGPLQGRTIHRRRSAGAFGHHAPRASTGHPPGHKPLHARLDRIASGSSGSVGPVDAAKCLDGLAVFPAFVTHTCVDTSERVLRAVGHGTCAHGRASTLGPWRFPSPDPHAESPARVRPPGRRAVVCRSQIAPAIGRRRLGATDAGSPRAARSAVERPKGRSSAHRRCDWPAAKSSAAESSLSCRTGARICPGAEAGRRGGPPSGGQPERRVPNGLMSVFGHSWPVASPSLRGRPQPEMKPSRTLDGGRETSGPSSHHARSSEE